MAGLFGSTEARVQAIAPFRGRSAPIELFGKHGGINIVPRIDVRRRGVTTFASMMKSNPLAFGPVYRIAMKMGALPIKVYRIDPETGVKSEDKTHPGYQLLRAPNPAESRSLFISTTTVNLLTQQKAAWLKVRERPDGPPVELWNIMPSTLSAELDPRNVIKRFIITVDGERQPVRAEDVCYFRLLADPDNPAEGLGPSAALAVAAMLGSSAIGAANDLFDNGFLGSQWIKIKGKLSDIAFRRLRRQMDQARSERFKIPIVEEGADIHDSPGPKDDVLLNAIKLVREILAETLGLPAESANTKEFYSEAIAPLADSLEQEMERSLFREFEDKAFPEFGFREITRGDPKDRAELWRTKILSGQATLDEARADDNLPPLPDGAGKQAFIPLNLIPVGQASTVPRKKDSSGGQGGSEGKGTLVAASEQGALVTARAARNDTWKNLRDRVVDRYAQAAGRQLRGILKAEASRLQELMQPPGRSAKARATEMGLPSLHDLEKIIRGSDARAEAILRSHLELAGEQTGDAAAGLMDHEVTAGVRAELTNLYAQRAEAVARAFGEHRADRVINYVRDAFDKGTDIRTLAGQIGEAYRGLQVHYLDGLARTEMAFAHEQAALAVWADSGVTHMEFVFGGGPCTTGRCEEVAADSPYRIGERVGDVGYSFEGADAPPIHPNCSCFAVPHIEG